MSTGFSLVRTTPRNSYTKWLFCVWTKDNNNSHKSHKTTFIYMTQQLQLQQRWTRGKCIRQIDKSHAHIRSIHAVASSHTKPIPVDSRSFYFLFEFQTKNYYYVPAQFVNGLCRSVCVCTHFRADADAKKNGTWKEKKLSFYVLCAITTYYIWLRERAYFMCIMYHYMRYYCYLHARSHADSIAWSQT